MNFDMNLRKLIFTLCTLAFIAVFIWYIQAAKEQVYVVVPAPTRTPEPSSGTSTLVSKPDPATAGIPGSAISEKASVTALEVMEDSRCPANANCIWAGTVKVRARVTVGTRSQEAVFTLREPQIVLGKTVTLARVAPEKTTTAVLEFKDYRFEFEVK